MKIQKNLQKGSNNPGPLAKVPQMIYLQKESSQSTQKVIFRTKKETKISVIKCQKKTLESGFVKEIFSNETYKSPHSLLSLLLCILKLAREIERVKERKEWKSSVFRQQRGARPVEPGARPVGRCATRPAHSSNSTLQWARPFGWCATRWAACATRRAEHIKTDSNTSKSPSNLQIGSR